MKKKVLHFREQGSINNGILFLGIFVVLGILFLGSGSRTIYISNTASAIQTIVGLAFSAQDPNVIVKDELHILLLGYTGPGHIAPYLTDTIISLSWDKSSGSVLLVSIPRDLLVQIPGSQYQTKINALYQIGIKEDEGAALILAKTSDITGFPYDYFIAVDIQALESFVDALGGVNVEVLEDIEDMRFPTPAGGYEIFSLEKGWRFLDGATTTKYVRTRHTPRGDFDRARRQQQVIEALRKKIRALHPITDFPRLLTMYSALAGHVNTNITVEEGKGIWALSRGIDKDAISFLSIEKIGSEPLIVSGTETLGGTTAFILKPRAGVENYGEIRATLLGLLKNKSHP